MEIVGIVQIVDNLLKMKIILVTFVCLFGCNNLKTRENNYISNFKLDKKSFLKDSVKFKLDLDSLLKINKSVFYSYTSKNVDVLKSQIKIDTILFDSTQVKSIILFTIKFSPLKDSTNKGIERQVLYDGHAIIAKKNSNNWIYDNYKIEVGNYTVENDCLFRLREIYLKQIAENWKEDGYNIYNINDKRFWNEPIWDKF